MNKIDVAAVELFLKIARKEIIRGNKKFIAGRYVTYDGKRVNAMQALLDLNITKSDQIWDYILKLTAKECIGISRDHDFSRDLNDDMYEFLTFINGFKVYIKLTINNKGTICLSFHKSNRK